MGSSIVASFFTWLDYSERERWAMLDAIDLLKKPDSRDERGLSPIRDARSERSFTDTIRHRA